MAVIRIDREKCKGCLLCVLVCPHSSIKQDGSLNRWGAKTVVFTERARCSGCCQCAIICPESCIEVYEE